MPRAPGTSLQRGALGTALQRTFCERQRAWIFAGARVSLSLAVIMMVVSEMVASPNGIGYFVLQSQRTYAITAMWSGISG